MSGSITPSAFTRPLAANSGTQTSQLPQDPHLHNSTRILGWNICLVLIFLRFTRLLDFIGGFGIPTSGVLYLFIIPAMIALVASGGMGRAMRHRSTLLWLGFTIWMVIATPFSSWIGGSMELVITYIRMELPMLLLIAGLPLTWGELRKALYSIALAATFNIISSFMSGSLYGGRLGLDNSTLGNPNDYAGHLIYVLPLALFFLICPPKSAVLKVLGRLMMLGTLLYGLYLILGSGSRGAFIALLAVGLLTLLRAQMRVRLALVFIFPILAALAIAVVPASTMNRLMSFSTDAAVPGSDEATVSASNRRQLLIDSVMISLYHPIVGVGPGEFVNYRGDGIKLSRWTNSHNSYTQISADTGLPGFFFYMAGSFGPFFLLQRVWKKVRKNNLPDEIGAACFCLSCSWVGFSVAIFFLNFGYFFYLPVFAALVSSLTVVVGQYSPSTQMASAYPPPSLGRVGPARSWSPKVGTAGAAAPPLSAPIFAPTGGRLRPTT